MAQTLARMTADASSLKAMAESVSRRTEWIEGEIRKQTSTTKPSKADLDAANARIIALSGELQAALASSMTLSRDLAAAKEELHQHEKKAIQLAAEARLHAETLASVQEQMKRLKDEGDSARAEITELRSELAEAWAMNSSLRATEQQAPPVQLPALASSDVLDMTARARRIEEDLRFERMHVQQLEERLNTWHGLAGAMLRKITRLGTTKPQRPVSSQRRRLKQASAPTRS
jgi:chromosome segregation ATPase